MIYKCGVFMKDILLSIFSALVGAILQKRYSNKLLWLRKSERLITPDIGDPAVKIYYKKKVIKSLSVAKILIINDSQTALVPQSFVNGKGIVIEGKGKCRLLRIDVVEHSDAGNKYSVCISKDHKSAIVKFHHFNPSDTFLLQIFHTGKQENDLNCTCSASGISKTERISIRGNSLADVIFTTIFQFIFCMCLLGLSLSWAEQGGIKLWLSVGVLLLIVLFVIITVLYWELEYRFTNWYKMARKNRF